MSLTLHELFEEQVKKSPNSIPVTDKNLKITYQELNARANVLAHSLRARYEAIYGRLLQKDTLVGLYFGRSIEAIVGMLGILKAGAAYVPLDPAYPQNRLQYLLEDSQVALIVTQIESQVKFSELKERLIFVDDISNEIFSKENPKLNNTPQDLAYVIYTSGTTGKPKGVMVEHHSVVNYCEWFSSYTNCHLGKSVDCSANINFDMAVTTMLVPLLLGLKINICHEDIKKNIRKYLHYIREKKINIIKVTPSYFKLLLHEVTLRFVDLPELETIILGGENLHSKGCMRWLDIYPKHNLFNEYGPTEVTVAATQYKIIKKNSDYLDVTTPIGHSGKDIITYVLNPEYVPVHPGEIGELFIGGRGLARGYLNKSELTDERFIQNPFSKNKLDRVYRTGDLVRVLSDLSLMYIGRIDRQIKLYGYRIELEEIEATLTRLEAISQNAVLLKCFNGNEVLVAFYVSQEEISSQDIRKFIENHLPYYMVPNHFISMDQIPLTDNGKVDYQKLDTIDINQQHVARNNVDYYQKVIYEVWQEILGISVSKDDHFFEVGGHSLAAIQVIQRIYDLLKIDVGIKDLYEYSKLEDFALRVKQIYVSNEEIPKLPLLKSIKHDDTYYPITFAQRRIWYVEQYENVGAAYNVPLVFDIEGSLNILQFENSFTKIISQYSELRKIFITDINGEPKQKIDSSESFKIIHQTCEEDGLTQQIDKIIHVPFNLSEGLLIKVFLLNTNKRYVLVILMHHIICDEITINLLLQEISQHYTDNIDGLLSAESFCSADYAEWEKGLVSSRRDNDKQYWEKASSSWKLESSIWQYEHQQKVSYIGNISSIKLKSLLLKKIKSYAAHSNISLHALMLSLLSAFVGRYFNKESICFLMPVASREHKHAEKMFGFFLNLLPVFQDINPALNLTEHAKNTHKQIAEILSHRFLPFEEIKALTQLGNHSNELAIDALVSYQNKADEILSLDDLNISRRNVYLKHVKFPISINFSIFNDCIEISIEYSTSIKLFDFDEVLRAFNHFINNIIDNPSSPLGSHSILSSTQKEKIIHAGVGSSVPLVANNVAECLLNSFNAYRNNIALEIDGVNYSYKDVGYICHKIALWIQSENIERRPVIVLMDRTAKSIFCCLGVFLAECIYVPITDDTPASRLNIIIEELSPGLVIVNEALEINLIDKEDFVSFQQIFSDIEKISAKNISLTKNLNDDSYIIYTSGSTGIPKGVVQTHRTIINLIEHMKETVDSSIANILQNASFNFDVSIQEIFFSFATGRKLFVVPNSIRKDIKGIYEFTLNNKIHLAIFTPSFFYELVNIANKIDIIPEALKIMILSGEKLILSDEIKTFINNNRHIKLRNQYGPTETHVVTEHFILGDTKEIPIGKPISNIQLHVLNNNMEILPFGVRGELYISGAGVANGYFKYAKDNNPFSLNKNNIRIYKTGDFVRLLSDGNLIYVGRKDRQIKIRGFRIELDEIEITLAKYTDILHSAVITKHQAGTNFLVAFYSQKTYANINAKSLREFILTYLPSYMVPNFFIQIDSMPLTLNGKVDYQKLESFQLINEVKNSIDNDYYQVSVGGIWKSVLGVLVNADDDFFELGGHSLAAVQIVQKVSDLLSVNISLCDLFKYPKLSDFIDLIKTIHINGRQGDEIKIQDLDNNNLLPLSSIQQGIWISFRYNNNESGYNLPVVFNVEGKIDNVRFENVVTNIIKKNKILNTKFTIDVEGNPKQFIGTAQLFRLIALTCKESQLNLTIDKIIHNQFDLTSGPLLNSYLITTEKNTVLIFIFHHIICDGRTIELFLSEIESIYNSHSDMTDLIRRPDYADYILYKNKQIESNYFINKKEYWISKLSHVIPLKLNNHLFNITQEVNKYAIHKHVIKTDDFTKLKDISLKLSINPFAILLGVFSIVARRITGMHRFNLLTVIDESLLLAARDIWGPLLNIILLEFEVRDEENSEDLMRRINKEIFSSLKNADYPFDQVLKEANLENNKDIFHTCLIYHYYTYRNNVVLQDSILHRKEWYCRGLKNPFSINFYPKETGLELVIEYDSCQYDALFIESFSNSFVKVLIDFLDLPDTKVDQFNLIDKNNYRKLLIDYNNTVSLYPKDKNLIELFEEQAYSDPEKLALKFGDRHVTYHQLAKDMHTIANNITLFSRKNNITLNSDSIIAIIIDRQPNAIATILALIKCGISYFPIDTRFPDLKIKTAMQDVSTLMLVTDTLSYERLLGLDLTQPIFNIDTDLDPMLDQKLDGISNNRIAILQTSGSSGKPKYVQIQTESVIRLVLNTNYNTVNGDDVIAHIASYSFDVSLMEIWCALLNGAAMLIVPHDYLFDFEKLSLYLQTNNVTSLFIPSKLFTEYSQQNPAMFAHLKYLFIGGDKLNVESVNKIRQDNNQLKIFNLYGPTENTTNTTCYEIPLARIIENPVPIGKPISNTKVYVLDDSKNPLPVGIPGELYIAGDGLSDGYLNDDVLTKTKFIELEIKNLPNKIRAYRSGDIVRWLSDGNLQFLGRKDRQVKINDVRLELDEIESYVVKLIKIQKCFVDYYESTGVIVYYIGDVDGDYLKNYLTQFFPSYHLPNRIIQIESLPFNTNGKVDRELLKNMYLKNNNLLSNDNTYFLEIIADIWRSVLKHNDFCYDSSFFDVGGTSIKVMTLNVLLDEKLGVKINPAMLFNLPTISNIAHHIKTNSQAMPVKLLSLVSAEESKYTNKIAIIAMNLRVPNANDVTSFWDKLIGGCELISKSNFPNDAGIILGVLEDYKYFSPVKYGISEREAELLDPQQRILLEMADDLLSDSGYIKSYNGKIGVFTGSGFNYYLPSNIYNNFSEFSDHEKSLAISANEKDFLATRIAYKLDLKGPAVVIGTACSSSLVAIIKACESLLSRESDMAIAGGISLVYPDALTFLPSESALYSKTNQCRPFSADSDGTLQSSGAGLVLLKRLDDAIHDKDEIIAVIDGYSVNNDGSNKQSFYSPNIDSQAENIQNALKKVNITADDIMYFETHGTATSLGDAVEIAAMNKIFNNRNDGDVSLGSVKANIGHTDAASGVIGLIKVALMLKNAVIPPQINFVKLNPLLEDMFQPFKVLTSQYNLSNRELKKYFGVSSLGVGGTNAHVLLTGYHLTDKIKIEKKCINSNSYSKKIFWLNDNKKIDTRLCDKDIEAELSSIWSQVTGIDNINKKDNFFDLGGDSLSAVSLCTSVNNRFGINLECNDILQFNTIERQLEFIFNKRNVKANEFLIKLNTQTKGKPLILIHPVGGGIFCYLKFAKYLEKFMPVYGIQNSILTLDGKAFDNLQDLAKFYNGKIKEMLPNDEFILGGWSFGGNVAYEMACQLAKLNQNIPKIYFFDSWNFSKLDFTHEILMREAVNQYIPEVIDLAAGYDMRNKQEFFDLLSKRMALVLNHKSDICGTDVVLFKAKNVLSQFQSINCENNHWHKIISDSQLSVISVNSSHDSLFNEKFVKELADKFLENIGLSL